MERCSGRGFWRGHSALVEMTTANSSVRSSSCDLIVGVPDDQATSHVCSSPFIEVMPASALSVSEREPNEPDDQENDGDDPQKM